MKAVNHRSCRAIVVIITLLAIAGCQAVPKVPPTATPTLAPVEIVVAEREVNCPIIDFEMLDGTDLIDPELGGMRRGALVSWNFDCPEPYLKGRWVGIQDFYGSSEDEEALFWTAIYEGITDEGGVWRTTADVKPPLSLSKSIGEGKYRGLQMSLEYNLDSSNVKVRVTRLEEE